MTDAVEPTKCLRCHGEGRYERVIVTGPTLREVTGFYTCQRCNGTGVEPTAERYEQQHPGGLTPEVGTVT
jgi:DnaJ-class molecular chaperone